jgi:hypothetical protein
MAAGLAVQAVSRQPGQELGTAPPWGGRRAGSPVPGDERRLRASSRKPWPGDPGRLGLLERGLRDRVDGVVRFDAGTRGAYSIDGSGFRQVPLGVVLPRTIGAAAAAVSVCGTSLVWPVHEQGDGDRLEQVLPSPDRCRPDQRRCGVEPGIVLDELNRQLARYGPEPVSHQTCTIGGMIGNNSCGATAQRTGTARYCATRCPLWTDTPQKSATTQT